MLFHLQSEKNSVGINRTESELSAIWGVNSANLEGSIFI